MSTDHQNRDENLDAPQELPEATLADTEEAQEERGRIGYGRNERTSSWVLGAVLIRVVVGIGAFQWFGGDDEDDSGPRSLASPIVGAVAPDFTMQTFSGDDVSLSDQQGKVVILNFWGSWCEPCIREMPAFQAYWESSPDDVVLIGVGSKQDSVENSREFAERFDITYPIGRDDGGNRVTVGTIAQDYGITFYPMTFVISPDGIISSLVIGEMDEDDLDHYVQKAREDSEARTVQPVAINHRRFS